MHKILIVEDDRNLSQGICLALQSPDYQLQQCHSLHDARQILRHDAVDLLLLDINLPDGSGLALLRELKQDQPTRIILLTANDTELDVVRGLEEGADDYITKPFSLAILRSRVHAQLRRLSEPTAHPLRIDDYRFDFARMIFSQAGRPIELSKTEQKLLRLLVEHPGQTMTRDLLLERVWGDGLEFVDENTLSVAIKRLRDKLQAADYIKTVYGVGYVWVVK